MLNFKMRPATNIEIQSEESAKQITKFSSETWEDLQILNLFFESDEKTGEYDFKLLEHLNEKVPDQLNLRYLKDRRHYLFDYRCENIIRCDICEIYRNPGTHHSSKFGYCVEGYDEYSTMFDLPICKQNIKLYISMQIWLCIHCIKTFFVIYNSYVNDFSGKNHDIFRILAMILVAVLSIVISTLVLVNLGVYFCVYAYNFNMVERSHCSDKYCKKLTKKGSIAQMNIYRMLGIENSFLYEIMIEPLFEDNSQVKYKVN